MDPSPPRSRPPLFGAVLVANRGEIACRVIRTLRRLGITAIAVYSDADADSPHVRLADLAVRVGPAAASSSYLDIDAVVEAARSSGAEAVHPGYGFLSENVRFARACARAGIVFIGPGERALEVMGDKIAAKAHATAAGVPVAAGVSEPGLSDEELIAAVQGMAYPLLIKPSAGGGGKGMHAVERPADLPETLVAARRVARSAFGSEELLIEELIRSPRHIEVQVLADAHGTVVHPGDRECSLQRRHQKVIEEAPSPLLDAETRERICQAACEAARSVDYRGAGTVEFLVSAEEPGTFSFMEMNTRLQVEHPVTEEVTGVDIVEQQIRIAAGLPLELTAEDLAIDGHAVEARLYAEIPEAGFLPATGTVLALREPRGPGIRVDSGIAAGTVVGADYDPMLAKIVARGADRAQAFARLSQALSRTAVLGLETNLVFLQRLCADDAVLAGRMDTTMIDRRLPELLPGPPGEEPASVAAAWSARTAGRPGAASVHERGDDGRPGPGGWRADGWRATGSRQDTVLVRWTPPGPDREQVTSTITLDGSITLTEYGEDAPGTGSDVTVQASGTVSRYVLAAEEIPAGAAGSDAAPRRIWLRSRDDLAVFTVLDHRAQSAERRARLEADQLARAPEVVAPLPGTVVAVAVPEAAAVSTGDALITIEAMKMEHRMTAPLDGIARLAVALGDTVRRGQVVATVEPAAGPDADSHAPGPMKLTEED